MTSEKRKYVNWSTKQDEIFLGILVAEIREGNAKQHDGKIRTDTWNKVIAEYNNRTGANVEKKHVESRMKTWRTLYKNYTKIAKQSGWGRDYIHGHIGIPKEIWDEFVQQHPGCKACWGKPCTIYDDLYIVFDGNMTTRGHSRVPRDFPGTKYVAPKEPMETFPVFSTQVPQQPDSGEHENMPSPYTSDSVTRKSRKRAQPHVESSQSIATSMNELSKNLLRIADNDDRDKKSELRREVDKVIAKVIEIVELTTRERMRAMELLEQPIKRAFFLGLPNNEMRKEWLLYYIEKM